MNTPNGPEGLVQSLIETLEQEGAELTRLHALFGRQLEALREQQPDQQEQALHAAGETVGTLGQLHVKRERQMRLLRRLLKIEDGASLQDMVAALAEHPGLSTWAEVLRATRTAVQEQAQQTRHTCEHLDFALQYAVDLGREMLQTIQDLDMPPPPCVYTAQGYASRPASSRSLVNKVG